MTTFPRVIPLNGDSFPRIGALAARTLSDTTLVSHSHYCGIEIHTTLPTNCNRKQSPIRGEMPAAWSQDATGGEAA